MLATSSAQCLPRVILVEDLHRPSVVKAELMHVHSIRAGPSWMDPLILFLKEDVLPKERIEADKIRRKAFRFWLSEDLKLYKRSFLGPYLLCCIQMPLRLSWRNCTKEFMGAIQGVDLCPIGP